MVLPFFSHSVPSVILAEERFLHFQLRRNNSRIPVRNAIKNRHTHGGYMAECKIAGAGSKGYRVW